MAEKVNIEVRRGDDYEFRVDRATRDITGELTPVDMTGYEIHFDLFFKGLNTISADVVIVDGGAVCTIDHTITDMLPDVGVYRVRVMSPVVQTLVEGTIKVTSFDGDLYV